MVSTLQLRRFNLFEDFNNDELEILCSQVTSSQVADLEFIFHEGDAGGKLFLITKGRVQILKESGEQNLHEEVRLIVEGEILGEMTFLENSVRSAGARAIGEVEALILDREAFKNIPQSEKLENKLVHQIALTIAHRMKADTESIIISYQKEREARLQQHEFGQFFIYILMCCATGMLINHVLYTQFPNMDIHNTFFAWSYLLALMLPGIFLVWKLNIPWARVGVTFSDWQVSGRDGIIASLALIVFFVVVMLTGQLTGILDSTSYNYDILTKPQYFLHCYGQEFLARGLLQNSLRRFLNNASGIRSVLISSFLFSLLHLHFGLVAVAITFVSSIALGYFYLRHKSLLGVTILHWSMGVCAFLTGLL